MSNSPIKKTNELFNDNLQSLLNKVKILDELNSKISLLLDPGLQKWCQVANLTDNKLTLIAASGSVATQLRFIVPELLQKFKKDNSLKRIQAIQIKVRPHRAIPSTQTHSLPTMPLLSTQTAEMIHEIAITIDDPKLKEVLMRISKHTKPVK